ncbi:MAG: replication initiator, partial [Nocardioidaceae bacterium]
MRPKLSAEMVYEGAVQAGVCTRPVVRRLTDTVTGQTQLVPIRCGSTRAAVCSTCAEKNRKLRVQQCREGWHLTEDPPDTEPGEEKDSPDENDFPGGVEAEGDEAPDTSSRRRRSTRRRDDAPDLPRLPVASTTLGRAFTDQAGKTWRPSMFVTLTLPSYGKVRQDGTPVDPGTYDYRRAGLDALHLPKLFDRFIQNLRRAMGYKVQYFAVLEPQRRLAPHLHVAIRGTVPRKLLRQVVAATYASIWWPAHDRPIYSTGHAPVWDETAGGYVDPDTGTPLPTWGQALDQLDADETASPAHVARFGKQSDMQGLIAGSDTCNRRVGYLTKYLTKQITDPLDADDEARNTPARDAHINRLHDEVRTLPCSPECGNWLAYGIQPKDAGKGMAPGQCTNKGHDREHLGCGGRRVLVSRKWTGKTLSDHRADRPSAVLDELHAAGDDDTEDAERNSASVLRDDGKPRYQWEPVDPDDMPTYLSVIAASVAERTRWRTQYEKARDGTA